MVFNIYIPQLVYQTYYLLRGWK